MASEADKHLTAIKDPQERKLAQVAFWLATCDGDTEALSSFCEMEGNARLVSALALAWLDARAAGLARDARRHNESMAKRGPPRRDGSE